MWIVRTAVLIGIAAALGACAHAPAPTVARDHAAHASASGQAAGAERMPMMERHMKAMQEMRQKMAGAATPQERDALIVEHMKAMHEQMAAMECMGTMRPAR